MPTMMILSGKPCGRQSGVDSIAQDRDWDGRARRSERGQAFRRQKVRNLDQHAAADIALGDSASSRRPKARSTSRRSR